MPQGLDNHRDDSPRLVRVVMAGLEMLGGLGGLGGVLLIVGTLSLLRHPVGIVVLGIGILLLIGTAAYGVATWSIWRSDRPRWLRILIGVLIGLPLATSAVATIGTVGTVGWLAITGRWR